MEIKKLANGKYECYGVKFASEEGAKLYFESRGLAKPKKNSSSFPLWQKTIIGLLLAYGMFSCASDFDKSTATSEVSESYALMLCQTALKRASIDPASAEVPYVERQGRGSEFYFAWGSGTKPVQMKNRLGLMIPAGASCIVDQTSGAIRSLSLDSKTIL